MAKQERNITVGDLRRDLALYPDTYEVSFSGLQFYRVKQRGPDLIQIEFDEQVYRDGNGQVVVENFD